MKTKAIQAKHVSDIPILFKIHANSPHWVLLCEICDFHPNIPRKVIQAKMRSMIKRGLVHGCACGCRGDFFLTQKGTATLNAFFNLACKSQNDLLIQTT